MEQQRLARLRAHVCEGLALAHGLSGPERVRVFALLDECERLLARSQRPPGPPDGVVSIETARPPVAG